MQSLSCRLLRLEAPGPGPTTLATHSHRDTSPSALLLQRPSPSWRARAQLPMRGASHPTPIMASTNRSPYTNRQLLTYLQTTQYSPEHNLSCPNLHPHTAQLQRSQS